MANDPQTTPLIHTSIFIPWCAGGSRDERLARKCPYAASIVPRNPINLPDRHSGEGRNPGVGTGNVVRGLVPRWGGGAAWQNPRCQFAEPSHNSSFSYLGVPATTGMGDWYENDVTRPRVCLNATAPALVVPAPQFVIPAKAGIHALTFRERTSTAMPPPTSTRRPHFVFPAKAPPEPRYGAGIQRGVGGANFHTFVCRRQPG